MGHPSDVEQRSETWSYFRFRASLCRFCKDGQPAHHAHGEDQDDGAKVEGMVEHVKRRSEDQVVPAEDPFFACFAILSKLQIKAEE